MTQGLEIMILDIFILWNVLLGRGESERSWGPTGRKWTVQSPKSGRSERTSSGRSTKVDSPQKCVGGQKGMKVDLPQTIKVDGPKMRRLSRGEESGRSSKMWIK